MMISSDVIQVLSLLERAGLTAWVDGGWGVDVLLGVDLHPVTPTPDGGGDQTLERGGSFHYPPPVLGTIDGQPVRCVDAETQVRCHLGYPPRAKDREDMRRLHERLGVELPIAYQ